DDAFVLPQGKRYEGRPNLRRYLEGEDIRDWDATPSNLVLYPYERADRTHDTAHIERSLWFARAVLAQRRTFQGVMADAGRAWWEFMQHTASPYRTPMGINFANVATHNHFA